MAKTKVVRVGVLILSLYVKDVKKSETYYQQLKPVFSESLLTKKVTY